MYRIKIQIINHSLKNNKKYPWIIKIIKEYLTV
jgi:hypothetical protein